nr:tetratricopeptide repeat protein [uncultured Sphingomonas sp.]
MRAEGAAPAQRTWFGWLGCLALLLLAVQAVRSAVVAALGERRPEVAHAVWSGHPLPLTTMALAQIGAAAREGRAPDPQAFARMQEVGRRDPLAFDPLLVAATARLAAGDSAGGERLLKAVLHREPRSTAAHFLLADLYVRQQRVGEALVHVGVLGRRIRGGGTEAFAAALAAYLRDPARIAQVRPVLQDNQALRRSVMTALAQEPSATVSLRSLSSRGDAGEDWFRIAFERLLAAGDTAEARNLLAAAGVGGGGRMLTAWSAGSDAGPLSWRLPATSDGVVEAVANGPLRLVYYGRGDTVLAEHLLLLTPGRYRLAAQFTGSVPPGTFEWRVTCLQGSRSLATWTVAAPSGASVFEVPADCAAQRLSLWGRMGEFPRTTSAELLRVGLDPAGAQP